MQRVVQTAAEMAVYWVELSAAQMVELTADQ
jgi:hypothetical protein